MIARDITQDELARLYADDRGDSGEVTFTLVEPVHFRPEAVTALLQPPPVRRRRVPINPGSKLTDLVMSVRIALMQSGWKMRQ